MHKNKFLLTIALVLIAVLLYNKNLTAQNNYIDLSYCDDGTCTVQLPSPYSSVEYMSHDSLGNLYLSIGDIQSTGNPYLLKVGNEGQIDSTFGEDGVFSEIGLNNLYQKGNYIFSLRIAGGATAINIYDLELNFIQRYIPAGVSYITHLDFNGAHLVGSTYDGFVFRYKANGQLDLAFGLNGLYNIESIDRFWEFGKDGYVLTKDGFHYCMTSNSVQNINFSTVYQLSNEGELLNEIEVREIHDFDFNTFLGLNFMTSISASSNDNIIIGVDHELINGNMQGEYFKTTNTGELITEFGYEGSILLPESEVLETTHLIGELKNENLIFTTSTLDLFFQEFYPETETTGLYIMKPQDELNTDFGTGGFLPFQAIPGNRIYRTLKAQDQDHIYITSASAINSSLLHITKLNLEDLPGTPVTSATKDTKSTRHISIYPSPAADAATLLYSGPTLTSTRIQILNTNGQLCQEIAIELLHNNDRIKIDTYNLSVGIYTLVLNSNGRINTHKLAIIR